MKIFEIEKNLNLISFISNKPGSKVCIVGGVHGDETCGSDAIDILRHEFSEGRKLLNGELLTIIANSKALKSGKRFIDFDLNRAFGNSSAIGYEAELAQQISPYLANVDYLIDLHSTSAPTEPFGAGSLTKKHVKLFNLTGFKYYSHGWEIHRGHSMLIDEVNRLGGIGVIIECGMTGDSQTDKNALDASFRFLANFNMVEFSEIKKTEKSKIISINKIIKAKSNNFSFTRKFQNLDLIKKDEIVAIDHNELIKFPYSFKMIMPSRVKLKIGDEAFGIGMINKDFYQNF